jgi:anti-anti-sigma factor
MAVVETVTNAIEHAYPAGQSGPIVFNLALLPDGQVECLITDYGTWHLPDPSAADRGNGLMVAEHMVDQMVISHPSQDDGALPGAASTVVRLLHRVRRPVMLAADASADAAMPPPWAPLAVETELTSDGASVWVRGSVDITTADEFLRRLLAACRGGTLPLTVDLAGVSHLASAGVSALYRLARQLTGHGNRLQLLARAGSPAQAVLDLVRLPYVTASPASEAGRR